MNGLPDTSQVPDNTPVLIGAGQVVEREATMHSPMQLAAQAAASALADALSGAGSGTNPDVLAAHIDTIAVCRLFSDMGYLWPCQWGRSNNPPQSIARAIGANPRSRIYSQAGGNQPQSLLIEFAKDIASGKRDMVLLAGAEALKNQRHADRRKTDQPDFSLDWSEDFSEPLEDRGIGDLFATAQELANGLLSVAPYYALIEQALRHQSGLSIEAYQKQMAQLLAVFSEVAANNPHAQFAGAQSAEQILAANPINHLYTKRMIAQDSVNQGAAILLCSLRTARAFGIPASRYIYLHGLAEGVEHPLSQRADLGRSPVAEQVVERALNMAGVTANEIDLLDIYSCFPCAITAIATYLGLATDGSRSLTLTGGLPYFGGPGNNYSMHAMAEAITQLRNSAGENTRPRYALVTANGGMLSKHAAVVYSNTPAALDWRALKSWVEATQAAVPINENPTAGWILSYVVYPDHQGRINGVIIGRSHSNEGQQQFVACSDDGDTLQQLLAEDPTGKSVTVVRSNGKLLFYLDSVQRPIPSLEASP